MACEAALRETCKMVDVADALTTRCTPLTEEVFDWNILEPSRHRSKEIPAYKASVAKKNSTCATWTPSIASSQRCANVLRRPRRSRPQGGTRLAEPRKGFKALAASSWKSSPSSTVCVTGSVFSRPRLRQRAVLQSRASTRHRARFAAAVNSAEDFLTRLYSTKIIILNTVLQTTRAHHSSPLFRPEPNFPASLNASSSTSLSARLSS